MFFKLLLLSAIGVINAEYEEPYGYESCPETDPGVLNVHIVAHTHDDVGWLKTVDQYYYGSRNNIQKAGVQYILDSVVKELWEDPKRKFIYVETAFFWKWWVLQPASVHDKVQTLVREGRLQFVGGAWSMNDEAASHYHSTIDQFTWGLSKIRDTFGERALPRVGWQIDPFGHSREFASLLSAMGYDGLFLGRIDYQDKRARLSAKNMEMVWRGDDDLGNSSDIFTGVLYNTYSPPPGFCFDVLCNDEPIIDDPDSPMYNADEKVQKFLNISQNMAKAYSTKNILVTMGEDFHYQDASMWFKNLDKLIKPKISSTTLHKWRTIIKLTTLLLRWVQLFIDYVIKQSLHYRTNNTIITMGGDFTYQDASMWYKNLDKLIEIANMKSAKDGLNMKLFYSTPNCYLKSVKESNPTLPTKQDDFFPYASDPNSYWTGYFTSRPTTKYFEREGNNYLQMIKQLQVLANLNKHNIFVLNELKSAMGVMQHHDAITGTEKQHVAHDYVRMLDQAIEDGIIIARQAFNKYMQNDTVKLPVFRFDRCQLNESTCYTSENNKRFVVTVYNTLAWERKEPIRIPVIDGDYEVFAPNGEQIDSQLVDLPQKIMNIPTRRSKATHEIVFMAYLHPLSYKSYYIKKITKSKREIKHANFYENTNDYWKYVKDETDRQIKSIDNKQGHIDRYLDYFQKQINTETRQAKSVNREDLDIIRVKNDYVIKVKDGDLNNEKIANKYKGLNDEEMRMLSDDPMIVERFEDEAVFIENQHYKLQIDKSTGQMTKIIMANGKTLDISFRFYHYPGCSNNNEIAANRSSGAYIFRPNATKPTESTYKYLNKISGTVVNELRIDILNGLNIIRLYHESEFIESEWLIGPIPIEDGVGKEYIARYVTNIVNNGEFYTDSNGRHVLKRKLNERPQWNVTLAEPVAGNYYPITNEISIQDDEIKFAVLTDRSQGGTSLIEGNVEVMLHRRLLRDDAFGVGEALNETVNNLGLVVRGKHRIFTYTLKTNNAVKNKHVMNMHYQPVVFVSDATNVDYEHWLGLKKAYSWLKTELPYGIHLLTLEPLESNLLLRLENFFEKSSPNSTIEVDLSNMFKNINIKSAKELSLSGTELRNSKWVWNKENDFVQSFNNDYGHFGDKKMAKDDAEVNDDGLKVKIRAKEIRTFKIEYDYIDL